MVMCDERQWYDRLKVVEDPDKPMERMERLRAINRPLIAWYENCARTLPWREDPQPYFVWISEIMLQQTRVEAVKPYFQRFIQNLPNIKSLAEAQEEDLLKLWEGLGYYNRARNLKKAAVMIGKEYQGEMPSEYEELLQLPGIGSYTAGAIASIAFGKREPAVDGNVLRVISRITASRDDISKASTKRVIENELRQTMPGDDASRFNQGLIEIGAIVCVPNGQPRCQECPLESICLAKRWNLIDEIPVKIPPKGRRIEKRTVCIVEYGSCVGLHRREDTGLLASLYELPNVEGALSAEDVPKAFGLEEDTVERVEPLPGAKHIFSHAEWHMTGYRVLLKKALPKMYIAAEKEDLKRVYALPNAFGRYTKLIN